MGNTDCDKVANEIVDGTDIVSTLTDLGIAINTHINVDTVITLGMLEHGCIFKPSIIQLDRLYSGELGHPVRNNMSMSDYFTRCSKTPMENQVMRIKDNTLISFLSTAVGVKIVTPLSNIKLMSTNVLDSINTGLKPVFGLRSITKRTSDDTVELISIMTFDLINFENAS